MKTKMKVIASICICFILLIGYIIFDYNNFLSKNLLNIKNINMDLLSIFLTNLVVILLYIITYFIVDEKKTIERKNKKAIVKYMLKNDYTTCLNYLNILDNNEQLKLVVEHINKENISLYKNDYFNQWIDVSFKNYNDIMQHSNQGIVEINILKQYLYIKSEYSRLITGYILIEGFPEKAQKLIKEGHQNLKKIIESELKRLDTLDCEE